MKNKAFSLLELAIVIVIIGLMAIGITSGQRLIDKGKLSRARMLTSSAPVAGIGGLALWLEPTNPDNITKDENNLVSVWEDLGPYGNDVEQSTTAAQPVFTNNAINGVPALKFDGINDFLKIPVNEYSSATTIFIVYKKVGTQVNDKSLFSSHDINDTPGSFQTSYYNDKLIIAGRNSVGGIEPQEYFESVANSNLNIISFVADGSNNVKGYLNGSLSFNVNVAIGFLPRFNAYKIGINRASNFYFGGYIAEVILYNSALSDEERQEVETYLSKKYGIALGS